MANTDKGLSENRSATWRSIALASREYEEYRGGLPKREMKGGETFGAARLRRGKKQKLRVLERGKEYHELLQCTILFLPNS